MEATQRDLAANAFVLAIASTAWVGWAQEGTPAGWVTPMSIGSVVGLLLIAGTGFTMWRHRQDASVMSRQVSRQRYVRVVGVEVASIVVGVLPLALTGHGRYISPWILFVVGVHFVPLGSLFRITSLQVLGVLLVPVSVAAVVTGWRSSVLPSAVAGAAGGVLMLAFCAWSLWRSSAAARTSSA